MGRVTWADKQKSLIGAIEETAANPLAWGKVCDRVADLVGGSGALIIPLNRDLRHPALPHSSDLDELIDRMYGMGWHLGSPRSSGFRIALSRGFVTDHEVITPEGMTSHPYYQELLAPLGLRWFIGIAFEVKGQIWGISVQGSAKRGAFERHDAELLMGVRNDLMIAVRRSAALGVEHHSGLASVMETAGRAMILADSAGRILSLNPLAEQILRDSNLVHSGRLVGRDPSLTDRLASLIAAAANYIPGRPVAMPRPVQVSSDNGRVYSVDALPMPREFQSLLSGARVLLTLHELELSAGPQQYQYRHRFGLTPREAELAYRFAAGDSVSQAAERLGMSVGTARHHLKSIFEKTGVHRQAELVALLANSIL